MHPVGIVVALQGAANCKGRHPAGSGAVPERSRAGKKVFEFPILPLVVGPHTRIDKAPASGDYVAVHGRLDAAGQVVAGRLRRR